MENLDRLNKSKEDMMKATRTSKFTLNLAISGLSVPSKKKQNIYAQYFGIPVEELFYYGEVENGTKK